MSAKTFATASDRKVAKLAFDFRSGSALLFLEKKLSDAAQLQCYCNHFQCNVNV